MAFTKFHLDFISQGDDNSKFFFICVCYFSMRNAYTKFQDDIVISEYIAVAKFQCPKFTKRAITRDRLSVRVLL